jgi:hypothetical protein
MMLVLAWMLIDIVLGNFLIYKVLASFCILKNAGQLDLEARVFSRIWKIEIS